MTSPEIVRSVSRMQALSREARREGRSIGLVPTMGALHAGHLSLVAAAKTSCDVVVASIFVNPLQFGPSEDFSRYPRPFDEDLRKLREAGVDAVFAPSVEEMYPAGAATTVYVEGLSERLDGASRPGHFRGVATVVAKLFEAGQPDRAFFGQKDAAQVAVLRKMTRDLLMPVELVVCPIMREPDGLAMSSRNIYLSPEQRKQALCLRRSLARVEERFASGERDAAKLIASGKAAIAAEPCMRLDYFAIVNWETLEPLARVEGETLVAVAAWVGETRLIDNVVLGGLPTPIGSLQAPS